MCPECGKPMIVLELEGIELDHCLECGGTWLDAQELQWLDELAGVEPGAITARMTERRELLTRKKPLLGGRPNRRTNRKCPRCRHKLDVVALEAATPIEIDRCIHGHGIWLDRGELSALVQAFGGAPESDETNRLARLLGDFFKVEFNSTQKGT